ncbi:MAG TPA: cation diffusion facilitator family transporter [Polyangiaceae bacterium]|jgi:cation diffusion facilitator family transporter|nr:cation diffusion facilitator family transporter [Polyangiaceae bacterium]
MKTHGKSDAKKVVLAALAGNLGIALAKFVAAKLSGSTAMLAEGVHSLADTGNQALLLVGMTLATRNRPDLYPLGREKESYFWAFIVALLLFFVGGVFAIYEGVHKLFAEPEASGSTWIPLAVLGVSLAMEGGSFFVASREFNKTRGNLSFFAALFRGKDPTVPVVLLEDTAAMFGLLIAFVSISASWLVHSQLPDALGSIFIGVLLCGVGLLLARYTRSLLLGEGVVPEVRDQALRLIEGTEGVLKVTQFLSMHLGPEAIVLALKVRFRPAMPLEELERVIDDVEVRVRAELPEMKKIFIEPDSDYDAERDASLKI